MNNILNHEICKGINLTLNLQEIEDFILRILSKAFDKEIYFRLTVKDSLYYGEETAFLSESFFESDNNFYNNKYNYMDKTVIFLNNNYIFLENWELEKLKLWKLEIVNEISRRRLIHHENILLEQTINSNNISPNEFPLEQENPITSIELQDTPRASSAREEISSREDTPPDKSGAIRRTLSHSLKVAARPDTPPDKSGAIRPSDSSSRARLCKKTDSLEAAQRPDTPRASSSREDREENSSREDREDREDRENTMINNTSTDGNEIEEQNIIKSDDEYCSDSISINSDIIEPRRVSFQNELNKYQNYGEISGISTSGTRSELDTDNIRVSTVNNQNNNLFSSIFNSQFLNMSENINLSDSYINNIIENCKNLL